MQITHIKRQVKNAERYSIYIDDSYSFGVSEPMLLRLKLQVGMQLSKNELDNLTKKISTEAAYEKLMALIARRPRSVWEAGEYLRRKGYDQVTQDEVISRLREQGYLDDVAFAESWIQNRRLLKPTSKRKLQAELAQKRVSNSIISACLEHDETDDSTVIDEIIARKRTQTRYRDDIKLMQYLSRQGFSYGDIKEAMERLTSQ